MFEFALIDEIRRLFPLYIGDDVAAVPAVGGGYSLLTVDEMVEGVHFEMDWLTLSELGYRAAAAAVSDIAASGGEPLYLLIALGAPKDFSRDNIKELYSGIAELCEVVGGADIVGGNIVESEKFHITTTVIGLGENPLTRSAARVGHLIAVTGELGAPRAFVAARKEGFSVPDSVRERFVHPKPRIALGKAASELLETVSAIDISDGLISDVGHILERSGVGARVALDKLLINSDALQLYERMGLDPFIESARSGEEFEIVITAPTRAVERLRRVASPIPFTIIGEIMESGFEITLNGEKVSADTLAGWEHR